MKLDLFYGRTYFESFYNIVQDLKNNFSINENYIFIVPDRLTLNTEKYLMEELNLESTFNINVITLNNLANRNFLINDYVDNETASMLVSKVLLSVKDRLKVFKSLSKINSFSEEVYSLISQIKSSQITVEEFMGAEFKGSDYDKLKKEDLGLIYSEYEKYLSETGIDSVKKFEMFIDEIQNLNQVKSSIIYLAGFETFTSQGYKIVENFVRYSKAVKVSSINSCDDQTNKYIYPNDISYQIKNIAKNLQIECVIHSNNLKLPNEHLVNNLWGIKQVNKENLDLKIFEAESKKEEYKNLAILINKNCINHGLKYSDFNIIMTNLEENQDLLKQMLDDFYFSYFFDTSMNLSSHLVIKFIELINEIVLKNFSPILVFEYSKNIFVNGSVKQKNNFEIFAKEYSIKGSEFYKEKDSLKVLKDYDNFITYSKSILDKIIKYKSQFILSKDKITNYIKAIKFLLDEFDLKNKYEKISKNYGDKDQELYLKYGEKVFERLDTLLTNLDRVLGNNEVSFREFCQILSSGLHATKISIVPQSVDAIYIGDIQKSFFMPRKINIFLDSNVGTMPSLLKDDSIFTDEDIENNKTKNKLNPTIKLLNKKARIKTLSLLSLGKTYIFYETSSQEPSKIIKDIQKISNINVEKCLLTNDLPYFLTSKNSLFEETLKFYKQNEKFFEKLLNNLDKAKQDFLNNIITTKQDEIKENYNDLFFRNNTFSISQIERFYSCPFKHYLDYGVKIKDQEDSNLDKLEVGNIIHKVCEEAIKNYSNNQELNKLAKDIFNRIISSNEYLKIVSNPKNKELIENLEEECVKIIGILFYHIENQEFDEHKTEYKFTQSFNEIYKKYFNEESKFKLDFTGKIDRVDCDKDEFIIIDYKTGSTEISYSDIYFGKKLQLVSYSLAIENILDKKNIGFFYMPIKNSYKSKKQFLTEKYKLSGLYIIDEEKVVKLDKRLKTIFDTNCSYEFKEDEYNVKENLKSDILNVSVDKKINSIKSLTVNLRQDQMDKLSVYTLTMINNALKLISEGYIKVSPIGNKNKTSCDYCKYSGICKKDLNDVKLRDEFSITKKDIMNEE